MTNEVRCEEVRSRRVALVTGCGIYVVKYVEESQCWYISFDYRICWHQESEGQSRNIYDTAISSREKRDNINHDTWKYLYGRMWRVCAAKAWRARTRVLSLTVVMNSDEERK